jgi:hypothetical protein
MNLYKGVVVSIDDETKSGIIKCRVNGLYNSEKIGNIPDELLPNVYPIYTPNLNNFDTPKKGEEVFIVLDRGDKYSPLWLGKYSFSEEFLQKLSDDYEGFKSIKFDEEEKLKCYYSRKDGLFLELDNARIIIKDNEIKLETPDRKVHVKDGMISLGQLDKSNEPSVLGDKNVDALTEILDEVNDIVKDLIQFATTQSAVTKSVGFLGGLTAGYDTLLAKSTALLPKIASTKNITIPKTKSKKTSLD